jgi:hypothetical protein
VGLLVRYVLLPWLREHLVAPVKQVEKHVRNERDIAHLGDEIDPNLQDASVVVHLMGWTLAEFVRLYHLVSANEAQRIIDELVAREVPIIQTVRGFPRVLRDLRAGEHCLVLLYGAGAEGASFTDLRTWVRPKMRDNLKRTLDALIAATSFTQTGKPTSSFSRASGTSRRGASSSRSEVT